MRRPLFAVCLCLVALIAIGFSQGFGGFSHEGSIYSLPESCQGKTLLVQGQVYRKESSLTQDGTPQTRLYVKHIHQIQSNIKDSPVQTPISSDEITFVPKEQTGSSPGVPTGSLSEEPTGASTEEPSVLSSLNCALICEISEGEIPPLGAQIQIIGQYTAFSAARNPGAFQEKQYYNIQGLSGRLKNAALTNILSTPKYPFKELCYQIREQAKERLYAVFPTTEASVMTAMLLGDTQDLDDQIKTLYKRNGIIHILSISGLHISLLGIGLYQLLRKLKLPNLVSALTATIVLLLYGMFTGWGISVQRAVGMYLLRMTGKCLGRTYDMLTALGIMGIWILLDHPAYLLHSGFLLSFASVAGIGLIRPTLTGRTRRKTNSHSADHAPLFQQPPVKSSQLALHLLDKVKDSFLVGFSVMYFTLPIQLWFYYGISPYSLLLNLFILPPMSILMAGGTAALLIPSWQLPVQIVCQILTLYEKICTLFQNLPLSYWLSGMPQPWQIIVYYLMLVTFLLTRHQKNHDTAPQPSPTANTSPSAHTSPSAADKSVSSAPASTSAAEKTVLSLHTSWIAQSLRNKNILRKLFACLWLGAAVFLLGLRLPKELQIDILDVGQGDSICIQTNNGSAYLIDGGSTTQTKLGKYTLIPYLRSQGIHTLDAVFITHPDTDHYSGILELLTTGKENGIQIRRLVLPNANQATQTEEWTELLTAAEKGKEQIPISYMQTGDQWQEGDTTFTCLHPPSGYMTEEANRYSLCLLLKHQSFSMLLTGDVEAEGEELLQQELIKHHVQQLTLLKAAHHGSAYSTSQSFLTQVQPDITVISCAEKNSYGHPHPALLERLKEIGTTIYITPQTGAIRFLLKRNKLTIQAYLSHPF